MRIENLLLGSLPGPDSRRLLALGELVPLTLANVLCAGGEPLRHVHFPESGFLSLVIDKDDATLSLFTTITTLGTPHDVTLNELRIESFFPADDATAAWFDAHR